MSIARRLRAVFGGERAKRVRVHVVLRGRIGSGWMDVDRTFSLPEGSTLDHLLDAAAREGVALREAIAQSPHLRHTLMLNGERCPVDANLERPLSDGDQVYLLAPLAGG